MQFSYAVLFFIGVDFAHTVHVRHIKKGNWSSPANQ